MLFFAGRVKHALDVPVDRPHDSDAREHRWSAMFRDQQRFHPGLPFVGIVFGLGQFGDVCGGVTEGTAIGSTNRLSQDTNLHLPPNWWRNEGIWHGQQAF